CMTYCARLVGLSLSYCAVLMSPCFSAAPAPPEIYTLSLRRSSDLASVDVRSFGDVNVVLMGGGLIVAAVIGKFAAGYAPLWFKRSEEHTSELQSREKLVCRLLLEKKNEGYAP